MLTGAREGGPRPRAFISIWLGQMVSLVGSRTSRFALGVWAYQQTGAVTDFALVALSEAIPILLLTPFAGLITDRFDRRRVMIVSDVCSAVSMVAMATLILSGHFQPWQLYLGVAAGAAASSLQSPAFSALTAAIVPSAQLGRATGMVMMGEGAAQILAPALAGMLLASLGIIGILLVDLGTFLVALGTLLAFRFPATAPRTQAGEGRSLWRDTFSIWSFIFARPGLTVLLGLSIAITLAFCAVEVLVPPLLLKLGSTRTMGVIMSTAAVGGLCGSVMMSVWGGGARRVRTILGFGVLFGLSLVAAGLRPSLLLMTVAGFALMFAVPVMVASIHAIWQTKVPPDLQGRSFGARRLATEATAVVTFLVAGPLADGVFEPLLQSGGPLVATVGQVIGVGPGRGIALLFILLGLLFLLTMGVAAMSPRLQHVERELEDCTQGGAVGSVGAAP